MEQTVCINPATNEEMGFSPLNTAEDVHGLVRQARQVQPYWAGVPVRKRARAIRRIRDYIVANADELAETIARDTGKTRIDALAAEIVSTSMAADYYARMAPAFLADQKLGAGSFLLANKRSRVVRQPYGVIAVISPWNYPFAIPFSEVVMGLLAGNTVLLKTATETQMVGRALERCFQAAGLPAGVFSFVNLPGRLAGDAFFEAGIDKLFFTGSTAVGKKLMAKAAETLTPLNLELGGNDAMIVCDDADLERASSGAVWGGMQNCGQTCAGVERIYVHASVYREFMELLGRKVRSLRIGYDTDFRMDMGAMTIRGQMDIVRRHIDDAVEKGASVYAQSDYPEGSAGNFLPATVLAGVDHSMLVMREETFGPVVAVMKIDDMDDAVRLANDSDLGLTGSVWSRDRRKADRLAHRIQAGTVMVNDHLMSHGLPETPWGGFKESGIGRSHGRIGFDEMTRPQCIVHDYLPGVRRNMWWHPYGPDIYRGLRGIPDFLFGRSLASRLKGLKNLAGIFPRTFRPW